jgi:NADH-quinone oxidoreductase subunit G
MLEEPRKAYLLLNVEPDLDCANPSQAVAALAEANFVAAITMYRNAVLDEHADLLLPAAAFTETSGSFVNVSGDWQHFVGVAKAHHAARPVWKILRVLGNFLHLEGFDYESSEEVKHEVKTLIEHMPMLRMQFPQSNVTPLKLKDKQMTRIGEIPIYATDSLVRRAAPLQEAQILMEGNVDAMRMHHETAKKWGLKAGETARIKQGDAVVSLVVQIDDRIAQDTVWIAGAIAATSTLGDLFGVVELC